MLVQNNNSIVCLSIADVLFCCFQASYNANMFAENNNQYRSYQNRGKCLWTLFITARSRSLSSRHGMVSVETHGSKQA